MSKQKKSDVMAERQRRDEEARIEAELTARVGEDFKGLFMQYLEENLTVAEYESLVGDVAEIKAHFLWTDTYRVNFWVKEKKIGSSLTDNRIKVSFFVQWSTEPYINPDPREEIKRNFVRKGQNIFKYAGKCC